MPVGDSSRHNKLNVLLIVLDAVRADHLSCYGYGRRTTPGLEQLCPEVVTFSRAFSASAWTPSAHASLFTGLYPSHHKVVANLNLEESVPTLAEGLQREGYHTYGVSGPFHISSQRGFARGFEQYFEYYNLPRLRLPGLGTKGYELSAEFFGYALRRSLANYDASLLAKLKIQRYLSRLPKERPFFVFVNLSSAHSPYHKVPRPFAGKFVSPEMLAGVDSAKVRSLARRAGYQYMAGKLPVSAEEWEVVQGWYDEQILYLDWIIEDLMRFLQRCGFYDDTLVIITADHGEQFGEHGLAYHQFSLYDSLLHIPLVVKLPAGSDWPELAGTEVERLVSLVDIAPTVYDVLGVAAPHQMDGQSLFSEPEQQRAVFAEYDPSANVEMVTKHIAEGDELSGKFSRALQAVRTPTYKYILASDGSAEMYDVGQDPQETHNIAAAQPQIAAELRAMIEQRLLPPEDWKKDEDVVYIQLILAQLHDLGYL